MAYFGVEHQIFQIINVEDQTTAIFKWEWWQRCLVFVLYAICSVIVISGEAMIIIYIGKYAPKERAINKIILVDQVSNLCSNNPIPQLPPTPLVDPQTPSLLKEPPNGTPNGTPYKR